MTEELQFHLAEVNEGMVKAISHLESELGKVRAGKASPAMLDGIMVDYYGSATPINQVASVNNQDGRTLVIQPWEKNMLEPIEKGILKANIGVTPMNDGDFIRLSIPPLTEERRKDLVKNIKGLGENAKVSLRSVRHKAIDVIKNMQKNGLGEDMAKTAEIQVQGITNSFGEKVDTHVNAKEKEIMTV